MRGNRYRGKKFAGNSQKGRRKGEELIRDVLQGESAYSIVLVGVAGMEYAAHVESKGYSVITPYVPNPADMRDFLKKAGLIE
jgi:hypothetical protein